MKRSVLTWLLGLLCMMLHAQSNIEIIVVGHLKTDHGIDRGKDHFLEMRGALDRIVYAYDSSSAFFVVKEYVSKRGLEIRDGERTVKQKDKVRTPHFSNRIPGGRVEQFLSVLGTNADSIPQYYGFVHTSHYSLNIYVDVVINGDTTSWHKSQPFESTTPWQGHERTVLDPAIDAFLVAILPKKFVGRDTLAKPRSPEADPTSTVNPALRVRDRSGKPGGC